jgi:hypothetical protein
VCTSFRAKDKSDDNDEEGKRILPSGQSNNPKQQEQKKDTKRAHLEKGIAKKFSVDSRDRAISALSQPNPKDRAISELSKSTTTNNENSKQYGRLKKRENHQFPKTRADNNKSRGSGEPAKFSNQRRRNNEKEDTSFSSLLPPPIKDQSSDYKSEGNDTLSDGLSSWEDFLGGGTSQQTQGSSSSSPLYRKMRESRSQSTSNNDRNSGSYRNQILGKSDSSNKKGLSSFDSAEKLPSISDLFPPDLSTALSRNKDSSSQEGEKDNRSTPVVPPPPSLDGVLPVSDLFYRSAQSMSEEEDSQRDDEELPFSAEQTDQLTTYHNKIKIRRNQARPKSSSLPKRKTKKLSAPRKMIRRGMEMLVGGVPINADPPQRYVDLLYQHEKNTSWHSKISINTRDFGPMWHTSSVDTISKMEQGLFCEYFTHYALKWDVCPKDLMTIVKSYNSPLMESVETESSDEEGVRSADLLDETDEDYNSDTDTSFSNDSTQENSSLDEFDKMIQAISSSDESEGQGAGFGILKSLNGNPAVSDDDDCDKKSHLGGELVFSIGVSREELESADTPSEQSILERVLTRGITAATECNSFDVSFTKLTLTDMDDGTTMISGEFTLSLKDSESMDFAEMQKKVQRINSSLAQAMDDGDMQLAMAAAAKEETGWPESVRDRVVEEFLFDDDDGDGPLYDVEDDEQDAEDLEDNSNSDGPTGGKAMADAEKADDRMAANSWSELNVDNEHYDGPFGMPGSAVYPKDDVFLGGGNDGVFWNYSEENAANAPYGGSLGLRLVDAVVERAKERHPRVIAIGDVHGCIDELQDLLRECDYRPGDLVVFLGDLVSKGPDSISVVQMAREIGAIGIRGNHDFEVIRWHQAIKSGVDPPVVGSEHFHIASCLSDADMKWMYSLPWYISSKELGALFVHAGFVSGIRLAKQNPRLMMNMRSILPDGTVTSKFFNNWPWARLWDGPQTVLFGHDADRGLQQYEHAIGLDTGCVYGGRLTACILPEKRLVSVSARREYFKYRRKHYD